MGDPIPTHPVVKQLKALLVSGPDHRRRHLSLLIEDNHVGRCGHLDANMAQKDLTPSILYCLSVAISMPIWYGKT